MSERIDKQRLREAIARHRPAKPGMPRTGSGHAESAGGRVPSAPQVKPNAQPGKHGATRERG